MPDYKINLNELMRLAFGPIGLRRLPGFTFPNISSFITYEGVDVLETDEIKGESSDLGTPVFMPVRLGPEQGKEDAYQVRKNGKKVEEKFEGLRLPDASLFEFNRPKNIVRTEIAGRDGTVKEQMSMGDWQIRVRGLIVETRTNKLPESKVQALNELYKVPAALDVTGDFFRILGIHQVVMHRLQFRDLEGFQNVQPYELILMSDEPIELRKKQGL